MASLINPANLQRCEFVKAERGYIALDTTQVTRAIRWFSAAQIETVNPVATCVEPPSHKAAIQLEQDIADALKLWRKIVIVPGAPIVRLQPDDMLASVNDSRNVTILPAVAA